MVAVELGDLVIRIPYLRFLEVLGTELRVGNLPKMVMVAEEEEAILR